MNTVPKECSRDHTGSRYSDMAECKVSFYGTKTCSEKWSLLQKCNTERMWQELQIVYRLQRWLSCCRKYQLDLINFIISLHVSAPLISAPSDGCDDEVRCETKQVLCPYLLLSSRHSWPSLEPLQYPRMDNREHLSCFAVLGLAVWIQKKHQKGGKKEERRKREEEVFDHAG